MSDPHDKDDSFSSYSRLESILGVCFPLGCGILIWVFVLLVNQ